MKPSALVVPVILGVGLLISAGLWVAVRSAETDAGLSAARAAAQEIGRTLTESFRQRAQAINRMALRWRAADGTPEDLWRADAIAYHANSPGELAIGRADASGTLLWLEPKDKNAAAVGFNLRSEDHRRKTFDHVRIEGEISMVSAINLAQGGNGFLIMHPIYRLDGTFDGVVTSDYRAQEAIEAIIQPAAYHNLKFDLIARENLLASVGQDGLTYLDEQAFVSVVNVIDQLWELRLTPSEEFLAEHYSHLPFSISNVSMAFSILLAMLAYQWMQTRNKAVKLDELSRELKFRQDIIDSVAIVAETDPKGTIIYANDLFAKSSGFAKSELIGRTHAIISSGRHPRAFFDEMWRTISQGKVWRGEIQNVTKSGEPQWYDMTIVPSTAPDGTISKYTAIRFDLTARILADLRLRAAIDVMENGFALFDSEDRLVMCNDGFIDHGTAKSFGNPIGKTFEEIFRAFAQSDITATDALQDRDAWFQWRLEMHRNPPEHPLEIQWTDGRWMRVTERRIADGGCVGVWTDITEQKEREMSLRYAHDQMEEHAQELSALAEEIEISRQDAIAARKQSEFLAFHDILTGLPNRRAFLAKLDQAAIGRPDRGYAILFVDLDKFKDVNDTLGHDAGDELLKLVADKLRAIVRDDDFVARLGGDEFSILLSAPKTVLRDKANAIGQRILENLRIPRPSPKGTIQVGCTIGIAVTPGDADNLPELMTRADQLMYVGKKRGKNRLITMADVNGELAKQSSAE
jgi:diguanylate cyclase (GGDEF)-like protein/PAS domain S-box-containing protein